MASKKKHWLRDNGLTLAIFALFLVSLAGQVIAGLQHYNSDAIEHGENAITVTQYVKSPQLWESLTENWESEFLQMAVFVLFTAWLFQRGSAESKDPDESKPGEDESEPKKPVKDSPTLALRGGIVLRVYRHSLSLALFALFALSFVLHAVSGVRNHNAEQLRHGQETLTVLEYVGTSRFWFESFQNWQSEFLSIAVLLVLTIFLRESGSSQSKPVFAPHESTGN